MGTLGQDEWAWDEVFAFIKTRRGRRPTTRCSAPTGLWHHSATARSALLRRRVTLGTQFLRTPLITGPNAFGSVVAEELRAGEFELGPQVQLCTDRVKMLVNNGTVEWPEKLSPITVGRHICPNRTYRSIARSRMRWP
jgi:hypothetical protein